MSTTGSSRSTGRRFGRAGSALLLATALLVGTLTTVAAPDAVAAPNNFVTMPDGIEIAINVRLPDGYVEGQRYPTPPGRV